MANLEFQPFQDGFSINSTNAQGFTGSIGDQNRLVHDAGDSVSASGRKSNFFSMEFYQQFFDVETDQYCDPKWAIGTVLLGSFCLWNQILYNISFCVAYIKGVLKRVLNSIVPTNSNFILDYVHPMPDLWGPFWISVTLVFSIGVFGNIAQYIQNDGSPGEYGSDFRLVTSSATLVFLYVVVVPAILSAILWQRKAELQYALSDLLCAYGYSLSIFIPVSILWTLDVNWFRWLLIIAAVSLSGAVLVRALWPAFKTDPNKLIAYGSIFGVILLHFLLAFTFKVYFFDAVHPLSEKTVLTPEIKPANNSGMDNSNSQVLITEKVEKILSTRSPNTTNEIGKGPEKEAIIKSNNLKHNVTQEKEQTQGVPLYVTAPPPAVQKSGS